MPNKRRAGLRIVSVWLDRETVAALRKLARKRGTTVSELMRRIATRVLLSA